MPPLADILLEHTKWESQLYCDNYSGDDNYSAWRWQWRWRWGADDEDNDYDDNYDDSDDDIYDDIDDDNDISRLHFPVYVSYCAAQPAMDRRLKQLRCLQQQWLCQTTEVSRRWLLWTFDKIYKFSGRAVQTLARPYKT